ASSLCYKKLRIYQDFIVISQIEEIEDWEPERCTFCLRSRSSRSFSVSLLNLTSGISSNLASIFSILLFGCESRLPLSRGTIPDNFLGECALISSPILTDLTC